MRLATLCLPLVLGVAAALAGCAAYGDEIEPEPATPTPARPAPRPVAVTVRRPDGGSTPLREWRGSSHIHTGHSHDSWGTLGEITLAGLRTGRDFVILTEHNNGATQDWAGQHGPLLVVAGTEISTDFGHMIVLGTNERHHVHGLTPQEYIEAAHAVGGVAYLAHPNPWGRRGWEDWSLIEGVDGLEVVNMYTDLLDQGAAILTRGFVQQFIGGRPGSRAMAIDPGGMLETYDRMTRSGRRLTLLSGSNAHGPIHVAGGEIASYEAMFHIAGLRLFAPRLAERDLIAAIRDGRAYVGYDGEAPADGFRLLATSGDVVETMGGWLPLHEEGVMIRATSPAASRCTIVLFRNGEEIARIDDARRLERTVTEPGVYRVECRLDGDPWVLANPVYVGTPPDRRLDRWKSAREGR